MKNLSARSFAVAALALCSAPALAQDDNSMDFGNLEETSEEETAPPPEEESPAPAAEPAPKPAAASSNDDAVVAGTDLTEEDRIRAVSRKTFLKRERFEFLPYAGVSTNDSFFRRWTVGGRVSYHLVDSLAVELGGAWNAFTEELPTIRYLRLTQNAITNDAAFFGYSDVGITFAPVYGKVAVMKEWILHFDAFLSGAVGATFDSNATIVHPAAEVGFGTRVFILRWLVVRAELRDYIYPQDRAGISAMQNLLMLNLGVGFYFPFDFDYRHQAFRIVG